MCFTPYRQYSSHVTAVCIQGRSELNTNAKSKSLIIYKIDLFLFQKEYADKMLNSMKTEVGHDIFEKLYTILNTEDNVPEDKYIII